MWCLRCRYGSQALVKVEVCPMCGGKAWHKECPFPKRGMGQEGRGGRGARCQKAEGDSDESILRGGGVSGDMS